GIFMSMVFLLTVAALGIGFNTSPITDVLVGRVVSILANGAFLVPLLYVEFNCHQPSILKEADEEYQTKYKLKNLTKGQTSRLLLSFIEIMLRATYVITVGNRKDRWFFPRIIVFLLAIIVGDFAAASYPLAGEALILLGDIFIYYELWRYVNRIWRREATLSAEKSVVHADLHSVE